MTETLQFNGRVVVITGAGRGLGRSYARLLAARGARVVVNDLGSGVDDDGHDAGPAQAVVAEIVADGGEALADTSDISSSAGAETLVSRAVDRFGRLDVVINNAGIVRAGVFPEEVDEALLRRHLDVHLNGTFAVTRAAWPHLRVAGVGRVVVTASAAVFGDPLLLPYSTAKNGVLGLMRSLALVGEADGIRVNAVAPSALTRLANQSAQPGGARADHDPMSSNLDPELVASLVAYLAHEDCPVSGEFYYAGGGQASRIVLATAPGYFAPGLSPEDVVEHWDEINDISTLTFPASMNAFIAETRERITV
jgi:NAD(P)-dependent dehydrogenase (short-subunit alcohol dehydrogenase family)